MDRKKLVGLIVLVVLLAAIPITLYLTKQTQIFAPKAGNVNESRIEVWQGASEVVASGSAVPVVTDPNVNLKIFYVQPSP